MKKIAVLDDSNNSRVFLSKILGSAGYEVKAVKSGITLFNLLEDYIPDLFLLDIMLEKGKSDGIEICKIIKDDERYSDIPVIILTSMDDDDTLVKALEGGADDFVFKRSDNKILLARIKSQLAAHDMKERLLQSERRSVLLAASVAASHELNQPLTIIRGNVELLVSKLESGKELDFDRIQKQFETITDAIDRISNIINKMEAVKDVKLKQYINDTYMVDYGLDK